MRALLLAEKPSVMRAIQEVYKKEGHLDQIDFGAFHGHLMELKDPEMYDTSWADRKDNSILPMVPAKFEYYPQDVTSVDKLMDKIRTGNYDYLINACDAGREGEHIFWSFYETEGLALPVKRFWASSVTKPAIQKALGDLRDSKIYDGMRQAAKFRAQFDWLVGMNFTRAASNKLGRFAGIGRVQSPTLKIIVDRELEIQSFVPQKFYEAKADFELNGKDVSTVYVLPDGKNTRTDKATADAVVKRAKAAKSGVVKDIKEVVKDTDAPTLYSLTELQKDANKYLKYSADRTLAIAQKLYEGGLLTYPRTESRFLPTDMIPEISQHLAPILEVPELAKIASGIKQPQIDAMLKKNYINDAGITDHHAIIPTDQKPNFSSLSKEEQALYTLVCKSFLAIFLPPYKVATSTVIVAVGNDMFKGQGRRVIDPGYSVLYQTKKEKEVMIPVCKKGDPAIYKKGKVAEGTTKPPQRYSPRTILSAMMNAGQDLPDSAMRSILKDASGLGTPATRADILKKLEDRKYVEVKDNMYYATGSGISLIKAIGERTFCSPMLTAQWEQKLVGMEEGKYTGDFRSEMVQYVEDETKYLLDTLTSQRQVVGKCPICGGDVIETEKGWYCRNVRQDDLNSCKFMLSKLVGGATLTAQDVESMISNGTTRVFTIKTKNGKNVDVNYMLNKAEKRVALMFANNDHVIGKCPFCGGDIVSTDNGWFCSSRQKGKDACSFAIGKVVGGTTLTDDDIIGLLKNKETKEFRVTTKDKRTPLAKYILSEADKTVSLAFVQEEKEVGKCPFCGGAVKDLGNAWTCENNSKDGDNKCGFWLARKLRGASVPEQAIVSLMSGKQTDPFVIPSNDGKRKVKVFLVPDPQTKQVKLRALVDKIGTCPKCGKPVLVGDKSMFCSGWNDKSCEFSVARVVKGATLSDADFVALLNGQRTSEHKFQWNNGNTGSAKLYLQGSELKFEFLQ